MDSILEEKRKGEIHFRQQIDQFLSKSIYTKDQDQLSPNVLMELLSQPCFDGLAQSGRINLEKLCQTVAKGGQKAELFKHLGSKKQIKTQELYSILKSFDLHQFNIQDEMEKYFFENGAFSLTKLQGIMKELGYPALSKKDKEIMIECFDVDKSKSVTRGDLDAVMSRCMELRREEEIKRHERIKTSNNGANIQ